MLVSLFVIGSAAHAGGLSTRHQSSLQHTVDAQNATYSRMGNSYAISGTNVTTTHGTCNDAVTGGLGVNTYSSTTGVGTVGTITAGQGTTNGTGSFSFAQSFTIGDIAGTDSTYQDFGNVTSHTAGTSMTSAAAPGTVTVTTAGTQNTSTNAPGTITAAHAITLTGTGNVGTSTTGQFVSEVTIFD